MPQAIGSQLNFNAGELGERLSARLDIARYPNAAERLFNVALYREGGWQRRPGTFYIGRTLDDKPARLLPHVRSADTATLLELTDRKMRFWIDDRPSSVPATGAVVVDGNFEDVAGSWIDASDAGGGLATGDSINQIPQNVGSTIGTMTQGGGLAAAFDGVTDQAAGNSAWVIGNEGWVGKTWPAAKTISRAVVYASRNQGFKNNADPSIVLELQGSNNAFSSSWVTLATRTVTDANRLVVVFEGSIDASAAFTSHRILLRVPSNVKPNKRVIISEIEFFETAVGLSGALFTSAPNGDQARLRQQITGFAVGQEHVIHFDVDGPSQDGVAFSVGTTAGAVDVVAKRAYPPGGHLVGFTAPAATLFIEFESTNTTGNAVRSVEMRTDDQSLNTPWTEEVVQRLATAQIGDIQWMASGSSPLLELRRYARLSWSLQQSRFDDGPWLDEPDDKITITPDGVDEGDIVTLTASATLFQPGHAGALFRLATTTGKLNFRNWTASTAYAFNDETQNGGNVYRALNAATSGTIPPVHEFGEARDAPGSSGVRWRYLHQGYGVVRLIRVLSATQAEAVVVSQLPTGLDANGTVHWREGAFSEVRGHPSVVAFHENRMLLADRADLPGSFWLSRVNDYLYFAIGSKDDDAIAGTVRWPRQSRGDVNRIVWAASADTLVLGTTGGPVVVRSTRDDARLAPSNIQVKTRVAAPVAEMQPVDVQATTIYVAANVRQLYELIYDFDRDALITNDLTVVAAHVPGREGFRQIAAQQLPWPVIWCLRSDGRVALLLYDVQQEIVGWARLEAGGTYEGGAAKVESVAVMPGNATKETVDRDVIYQSVARTINGQTVRTIEFYERMRQDCTERKIYNALDASVVYDDAEAPVSTLTGLAHLEGETVRILANGIPHPPRVVSGGSITLDLAATQIVAGLDYQHSYRSLKRGEAAALGSAQGQRQRVNQIVLVVRDSTGGRFGVDDEMFDIQYPPPATQQFAEGGLFSGAIPLDFPGGWSRDARMEVEGSGPEMFECLAVIPRMNTNT